MKRFSSVVWLIAAISTTMGADCRWDKDADYPSDPPLIMDESSWWSVLPSMEGGARVTTVAEGTPLVLACPETVIEALQRDVAAATCVGGLALLIDGQEYTLSELGCSSTPKEAIQRDMGPCGAGGETYAIGFDVVGYPFYELIVVCFDHVFESTLFATHTVRGQHIEAKDIESSRPSFKSDSGFYTVSVNTCYLQDSQIALMDDILGDSSVIDVSNSLYFARGHMAPDADFVTAQEQDATYYYMNAAPQWQAFNNGNWKYLEFDTRDLAIARSTDLQVWSGAWNVLQLDDTNNNPVDIFLGLTEGKSVLPAPDVTWKVVYDPSTNEGAGIVGVNNPYLTSSPPPLCGGESVCGQLSWLTVDVTDYGAGATYCCTVQDLRAAIPNAPDLGDAALLTNA